MDAFDELMHHGALGTECYNLFLTKAKQVTRRHNFPPPLSTTYWDRDALRELVHDVLAIKGSALTLALLACASQDQIERLVATTILNVLRDQAKATELGKLRRRLEGLLRNDIRFLSLPDDRWSVGGGPTSDGTPDTDQLRITARLVTDVSVKLPLNVAGPTPSSTVAAFTAVAFAVIKVADGAVHIQTLTSIIAERFRLLVAPPVSLHDENHEDLPWPTAGPDPSEVAADHALGREVWLRLDEVERTAVGHLDSLGDLAAVLQCGPREAEAVVARVRAKITEVAHTSDEQASAVAGIVAIISTTTPPVGEVTSSVLDVAATPPAPGEEGGA